MGEQIEKNPEKAYIKLSENSSLDSGKFIGSNEYYVSLTNKGHFGTTFQNIITGSLETLKKRFGQDCCKTAKFIETIVDNAEDSAKVIDKYSKTMNDFKQSMK